MRKDMTRIQYEIEGVSPLLMHNGRLADPTNPIVMEIKKITSKGKRQTEEDHAEKLRLEWRGGMYYDSKAGPYVPGDALTAMLIEGARKSRKGKQFESAVYTEADIYPLDYKGPRDMDKLWAAESFKHTCTAKIGGSTVMRCRPYFREWSLKFDVVLLPSEVNESDVDEALEKAGLLCGLGDWRPRHGRFVLKGKRVVG